MCSHLKEGMSQGKEGCNGSARAFLNVDLGLFFLFLNIKINLESQMLSSYNEVVQD